MNTRLENLILSGLVAAAISVSVSGAQPTPLQHSSGPTIQQQLDALKARVDAIQNTQAREKTNLRRVANQTADASTDAGNALDALGCFTGAQPMMFHSTLDEDNQQTDYFTQPDAADIGKDTPYLAIVDPSCFEDAS